MEVGVNIINDDVSEFLASVKVFFLLPELNIRSVYGTGIATKYRVPAVL